MTDVSISAPAVDVYGCLRMEEERAQKTGMIAYCLIFNNLDRRPFLEPAGLQLHIKIIISQHFIL